MTTWDEDSGMPIQSLRRGDIDLEANLVEMVHGSQCLGGVMACVEESTRFHSRLLELLTSEIVWIQIESISHAVEPILLSSVRGTIGLFVTDICQPQKNQATKASARVNLQFRHSSVTHASGAVSANMGYLDKGAGRM